MAAFSIFGRAALLFRMRKFIFLLCALFLGCSFSVREAPGTNGRIKGRFVQLDSGHFGMVGKATSTESLTFPKSVKYTMLGVPKEIYEDFGKVKQRVFTYLYVVMENRGYGDWDVVVQIYSE